MEIKITKQAGDEKTEPGLWWRDMHACVCIYSIYISLHHFVCCVFITCIYVNSY